MSKRRNIELDFEVNKLTNSIENALTGEIFETEVTRLVRSDLIVMNKNEWGFDWSREFRDKDREVFKVITRKDPSLIQGLLSLSEENDHVWLHLVESALFNRGRAKTYDGVPGNLVAFACKYSFEKGFGGYVLFQRKQDSSNITRKPLEQNDCMAIECS